MIRKLRLAVALVLGLTAAPAVADTLTIAALGDSLTQGYGLARADGFVPQMQAWLDRADADVTLVNAGVSGDTTAGGLSRVEWTLTPDVDGMIVALGGNDLLRGLAPATSKRNLDGILSAARDKDVPVLLIGISAPGNFGAEYKADFDGMYPDLAETYGTLLAPDFLGALNALPDRQTAIATYIQGDGVHPNAKGVDLIVQDLGPKVLELVAELRAK